MAGYVYRGDGRSALVSLAQLPGAPRIIAASSEPIRPGARPQYSRKKREQIAAVADGVTLACIDLGLRSIPNDRRFIEHALSTSWRTWTPRIRFDSIQHSADPVGAMLADALMRSGRRFSSRACWRLQSHRLVPAVRDGIDVRSALNDLDAVSPDGWQSLATALIRSFGPMAEVEPAPEDRADLRSA